MTSKGIAERRALVEDHRSGARDALTLSGLAAEIRHLQASLDAIAAAGDAGAGRSPAAV